MITIHHVPEHEYALVELEGEIDVHDIVRAGTEMARHPSWRPGFTEAWDLRHSLIDLSPSGARVLLQAETEVAGQLAGSHTIIIVNRPLIRYSVGFFAHLIKPLGRTLSVVSTPEEAARQLGVDALPRTELHTLRNAA